MSNGYIPGGMGKQINCPSCKDVNDKPVNIWFRTAPLAVISAVMSKSGKRETISYEVWRCLSCGHVLTENDIDVIELTPKGIKRMGKDEIKPN